MVLIFKNWDEKLIKASSRGLSLIILFGIELAFLTLICFVVRPSTLSCNLLHLGFHISVVLMFAPLLVKTNRVYRIFLGGRKGVQKVKFISSHSQVFVTCILITGQVRIFVKCITTFKYWCKTVELMHAVDVGQISQKLWSGAWIENIKDPIFTAPTLPPFL